MAFSQRQRQCLQEEATTELAEMEDVDRESDLLLPDALMENDGEQIEKPKEVFVAEAIVYGRADVDGWADLHD